MKLRANQIPITRLIFYLVIIGFLPAIFISFDFYLTKKEWDGVQEKIRSVHRLSEAKAKKQYLNTIVRKAYTEIDHFYLENQLEPLTFLKKEKERLEQLFQSPSFTGNESAEKRYVFISSNANRLAFMQGNPNSSEGIQEVNCMLSHPVEIDTNDLKEILNRIEGYRKGKPQLIISDFKINKKAHLSGNEVFELNLKLKKREFQ